MLTLIGLNNEVYCTRSTVCVNKYTEYNTCWGSTWQNREILDLTLSATGLWQRHTICKHQKAKFTLGSDYNWINKKIKYWILNPQRQNGLV